MRLAWTAASRVVAMWQDPPDPWRLISHPFNQRAIADGIEYAVASGHKESVNRCCGGIPKRDGSNGNAGVTGDRAAKIRGHDDFIRRNGFFGVRDRGMKNLSRSGCIQ